MPSLLELDIRYLASLSRELQNHIMDENISILPQLRERYAQRLSVVLENSISAKTLETQSTEISNLCNDIGITVNLERYYTLDQCIQRIHTLLEKLSQNSLDSSSDDDSDILFQFMRNRGFAISKQELHKGNSSPISAAYEQGYLSISEAFDALSAIFSTTNNLEAQSLRYS